MSFNKISFLLYISLIFFNTQTKAENNTNSALPPYYGTARYPYWGLYKPVPMTEVKAAKWINTDTVVVGWDWSLPNFVKLPNHSTFSLLRTGLSTTELNKLQKPSFPCKPSVAFWISWKDLEAVEGTFTFSQLISNIRLAASKGYQSIVRIHSAATVFAPAWVGNLGIKTTVGSKVTYFDVADPRFHALYLKLVEAIGKSGITQMPEVTGLYVGYASGSYGDEGVGPYNGSGSIDKNDAEPHVRERLDAWANICKGVDYKVFMGGESYYGQNKGFGVRRGFVEMYMNNIPNDYLGQKLDANGYLYVDESVPEIKRNLYNGDENEEYGTDIATSAFSFRFGPTTESFNYRYFSSSIRVLQMRTNELLNHKDAVLPEMTAWVGQNLGRTIDEAPDVFSFLRETRVLSSDIKNFERWLYQRDAVGYTTVATKKIYYDNYQSTNVRAIGTDKMHDKIAREGKKIGFNIDKNWAGVRDSLAFKVSVFDDNAGTLNLKYSNGTEVVTLTKPLLGDSLLRTYTFFVPNFKLGANIGSKFDFTLEAGDNTKSIVVSFLRVIQAGTTGILNGVKNYTTHNKSNIIINCNNVDKYIYAVSENKIKSVTIYNMSGKNVATAKPFENQIYVATSNLTAGVYIVEVIDKVGNAERKKVQIR